MSAEEDLKRLVEAWEDRLTRRGTLAAASEAIGFDESYISRVKGEKRGPRSLDLLRSLYAVNDPWPGDVFHDAYSTLGVDHARLLECAREFQPLAADRFLRSVGPRLRALAAAGPTASTKHRWQSRRAKIAELDELRKQDRKLAKERLQDLILWGLGRLEDTGERPRAAFGDLSCALGVLAAIHRLAGRRDAAMDCLLHARPLSLLDEPNVMGQWYQKATYLLVDLNRFDRAYEFAHEALKYFVYARSAEGQATALVDIGYVESHANMHQVAVRTLLHTLPLIQESDRKNRLAAHQILATELIALGEFEAACRQVEAAIPLVENDLLALASLNWNRGRLAGRTGAVEVAVSSFQKALTLYVELAGAGEVIEVALDYAALLLKEDRRSELRQLATDVSGWVHQLKCNRKLRDVMTDFSALASMGGLKDTDLRAIRRRVANQRSPIVRSRRALQGS